jgi:hypothetical protein
LQDSTLTGRRIVQYDHFHGRKASQGSQEATGYSPTIQSLICFELHPKAALKVGSCEYFTNHLEKIVLLADGNRYNVDSNTSYPHMTH